MKILISGYYGFGNAGDELILECVICEIKNRIAGAEITVLSANPAKTADLHRVKSVNRWSPRKVIGCTAATDILVSGGGGLFQDKTGTLSLFYYLSIILLAKLLGKKVFIFAAGVSELKKFNRAVTLWVLKMADFITLRNEESVTAIAGKADAVLPQLEVTADPVFLKNVNVKKLSASNPAIGMILRAPRVNRPLETEIYAKFADAVCQRFSAQIVFIPFHETLDHPYTLAVMNSMRSVSRIVVWNKPSEIYDIFSELDMVISQRLHGLILASLYGIPLIGISQDTKIMRFLKELKQKNFSRVTEENLYSVLAIINDLWEWREDFRKNSLSILPALRKRAMRNTELFVEIAGE
jgi:polysaccharide pyruvyl transferase CsaB